MKMTFDFKRYLQVALVTVVMAFSSLVTAESGMENRELAEKSNQNWNLLFNRGDVKALTQLYSEAAILSPGNGQVLKGQEEIETLLQSFVDGGVHDHAIEVIECYRDGDFLYQVSKWSALGQESEGVTPSFGGVVTLISRKDAQGEWKLHLHSWNVAN
jgi:ketosteroid isomerase-like protein